MRFSNALKVHVRFVIDMTLLFFEKYAQLVEKKSPNEIQSLVPPTNSISLAATLPNHLWVA